MTATVSLVVNGFDLQAPLDAYVGTIEAASNTVVTSTKEFAEALNQGLCVGWYAHDVVGKTALPKDATDLQKQVRDVRTSLYAKLNALALKGVKGGSNPSKKWKDIKEAAGDTPIASKGKGEGEGEGEGGTASSDKPLDVQIVKILESLIKKVDKEEGVPSVAAFKARAAAINVLQDAFNVTWTEGKA